LSTTVRFSDEFWTHSRIGLLWTTFKSVTPLRGGQIEVSPTDSAEEAKKGIAILDKLDADFAKKGK
jgi:hypothetical protein